MANKDKAIAWYGGTTAPNEATDYLERGARPTFPQLRPGPWGLNRATWVHDQVPGMSRYNVGKQSARAALAEALDAIPDEALARLNPTAKARIAAADPEKWQLWRARFPNAERAPNTPPPNREAAAATGQYERTGEGEIITLTLAGQSGNQIVTAESTTVGYMHLITSITLTPFIAFASYYTATLIHTSYGNIFGGDNVVNVGGGAATRIDVHPSKAIIEQSGKYSVSADLYTPLGGDDYASIQISVERVIPKAGAIFPTRQKPSPQQMDAAGMVRVAPSIWAQIEDTGADPEWFGLYTTDDDGAPG